MMGLRLGFGARIGRHAWNGYSVPIGRVRRCVGHDGHAEPFDPISFVIGCAILWGVISALWAAARGG